jgi:hypothetical protein
MFYSGFADEASDGIEGQIEAIKEYKREKYQ